MEDLRAMTHKQKARLVQGHDMWYTHAFDAYGIKSICLSDGPGGLCQKAEKAKGVVIANAVHATAFPVPAAMASAWDEQLIGQVGQAIGRECRYYGTHVLLAPGMNLKRNPLCGRNFEYYSEDPLLSGHMAAAFVKGVQSVGAGACVKHFALNGREHNRLYGNSVTDERALREVWLRGFEIAVKKGKPYTVMAAYNQVNGTYAAQSKLLLQDILREEWGFDGLVMSDWGGISDRGQSLLAGCDLEMPGQVAARYRQTVRLSERDPAFAKALDLSAQRVATLAKRCTEDLPDPGEIDFEAHATLAEQSARQGAVLLQNDGVLPLSRETVIYPAGPFFAQMRYQGAGSSLVNPAYVDSPAQALSQKGISWCGQAEQADVILYFGGLTDLEECEGEDRADMKLPQDQLDELERLCGLGKPVVLVLFTGAPVEIPQGLSAILLMHLPGMRGGNATVSLLYGEENPSGRLSETWLRDAAQSYCAAQYENDYVNDLYTESVYVGYRYYDAYPDRVRYPFGYGLSYTQFAYSAPDVRIEEDYVTVQVSVTNTGKYDGAEVVQVYVQNAPCEVFRPQKELRAYRKVWIGAGQSVRLTLQFALNDLSYWHVGQHAWVCPSGEYRVIIAQNAQRELLSLPLYVQGQRADCPYSDAVMQAYARPIAEPGAFEALYGALPKEPERLPLHVESPLRDYRNTLLGRGLWRVVTRVLDTNVKKASRDANTKDGLLRLKNAYFIRCMMPGASMRTVASSSSGRLPMGLAKGIAWICRGHK